MKHKELQTNLEWGQWISASAQCLAAPRGWTLRHSPGHANAPIPKPCSLEMVSLQHSLMDKAIQEASSLIVITEVPLGKTPGEGLSVGFCRAAAPQWIPTPALEPSTAHRPRTPPAFAKAASGESSSPWKISFQHKTELPATPAQEKPSVTNWTQWS